MDPKLHQNRAPEAPKTLLEPGCRRKLVSEPFWGPFWTPRDPENRALAVARCYFFANLASRAREPEIAPQMNPKSSLKRPPEAPECPKMSLQIGARISIKFQLRFWRFWSPKMAPKIAQKNGLRAQGPPKARPGPAQRPPESPSGGILGSFWPQFGPSGGSCSSFFGVHVCFFWLAARLLLVLFFSCVLSSTARLLSHQATRHRSPKR